MEQYERDFKGVFIPAQIYLDKNLSALDKMIYVEIDSLSHTDKGCIASNTYLAEFCVCSESKVSKSISKLIELGYVKVESFNGRVRVLRGCLVKNARQTSKKCQAAWQKMLHSNNSIDNESISMSNDIDISSSNSLDGATAPNPDDSANAPSSIISSTADEPLFPEMDSQPVKKKHSRTLATPTLDEVKAHVKSNGYNIDPEYFYEYYNSANWHYKDGKPVKNWKQAMVTWVHNNYNNSKPVVKKDAEPEKKPKGISKSFKEACAEIGVHWEPSYDRIASAVHDLREWFADKSDDKAFAEKNKWGNWESLRSLTGNFYSNFWHSYISYIADLLKGEQPKPGHFKVGGGAFNSWCIEMEIEV